MVSRVASTPRRKRTTVSRRRDATCSRVLARSVSSSAYVFVASISARKTFALAPEAFEDDSDPRHVRFARTSSSHKRSSSSFSLAFRSRAAFRASARNRTFAETARTSRVTARAAAAATSSTAAATCVGASATSARRDAETRAARGDIRFVPGREDVGSDDRSRDERSREKNRSSFFLIAALFSANATVPAAFAAATRAAYATEGASLGVTFAFAFAVVSFFTDEDVVAYGDGAFCFFFFFSGSASAPLRRRVLSLEGARGQRVTPGISDAASTASTSGAASGWTRARRTRRSRRAFRTSCLTLKKCVAPTPFVKSPPPPPPTPPRDLGRSVSSSTSSKNKSPWRARRFEALSVSEASSRWSSSSRSFGRSADERVAEDEAKEEGACLACAEEKDAPRSVRGEEVGGARGDAGAAAEGKAFFFFAYGAPPRASGDLEGDGTRSGSRPLALRTALCTISLLSRMRSRGSGGHRVLYTSGPPGMPQSPNAACVAGRPRDLVAPSLGLGDGRDAGVVVVDALSVGAVMARELPVLRDAEDGLAGACVRRPDPDRARRCPRKTNRHHLRGRFDRATKRARRRPALDERRSASNALDAVPSR